MYGREITPKQHLAEKALDIVLQHILINPHLDEHVARCEFRLLEVTKVLQKLQSSSALSTRLSTDPRSTGDDELPTMDEIINSTSWPKICNQEELFNVARSFQNFPINPDDYPLKRIQSPTADSDFVYYDIYDVLLLLHSIYEKSWKPLSLSMQRFLLIWIVAFTHAYKDMNSAVARMLNSQRDRYSHNILIYQLPILIRWKNGMEDSVEFVIYALTMLLHALEAEWDQYQIFNESHRLEYKVNDHIPRYLDDLFLTDDTSMPTNFLPKVLVSRYIEIFNAAMTDKVMVRPTRIGNSLSTCSLASLHKTLVDTTNSINICNNSSLKSMITWLNCCWTIIRLKSSNAINGSCHSGIEIMNDWIMSCYTSKLSDTWNGIIHSLQNSGIYQLDIVPIGLEKYVNGLKTQYLQICYFSALSILHKTSRITITRSLHSDIYSCLLQQLYIKHMYYGRSVGKILSNVDDDVIYDVDSMFEDVDKIIFHGIQHVSRFKTNYSRLQYLSNEMITFIKDKVSLIALLYYSIVIPNTGITLSSEYLPMTKNVFDMSIQATNRLLKRFNTAVVDIISNFEHPQLMLDESNSKQRQYQYPILGKYLRSLQPTDYDNSGLLRDQLEDGLMNIYRTLVINFSSVPIPKHDNDYRFGECIVENAWKAVKHMETVQLMMHQIDSSDQVFIEEIMSYGFCTICSSITDRFGFKALLPDIVIDASQYIIYLNCFKEAEEIYESWITVYRDHASANIDIPCRFYMCKLVHHIIGCDAYIMEDRHLVPNYQSRTSRDNPLLKLWEILDKFLKNTECIDELGWVVIEASLHICQLFLETKHFLLGWDNFGTVDLPIFCICSALKWCYAMLQSCQVKSLKHTSVEDTIIYCIKEYIGSSSFDSLKLSLKLLQRKQEAHKTFNVNKAKTLARQVMNELVDKLMK